MADARKRARRDTGALPPSPDGAGRAASEPEHGAAEAELVFPAEPEGALAAPAPGSVRLPASGLAEDILRQIDDPGPAGSAGGEIAAATSPVAPRPPIAPPPEDLPPAAAEPAGRIELPASGLAEDILGRPAVAATGAAQPALPAAAPAQPEPQAGVPGAHSLSFFAAPAQEHRAAAEATEHLVTFFLDREEYGMDVRQVQEIRRLTEITSVPRAPEFVRGVINLRGRILPVLDLKLKLGLGEVAESRAARIVVVRVRERLIGLLVDGASQVPKIPVSRIEAPPEEVVERGGDYIRGVAKLDDRLIILVDLERLLAHELKAAASPAAAGRATVGREGVS